MRKRQTAQRVFFRGFGICLLVLLVALLIGADIDVVSERAPFAGMIASLLWAIHEMEGGE